MKMKRITTSLFRSAVTAICTPLASAGEIGVGVAPSKEKKAPETDAAHVSSNLNIRLENEILIISGNGEMDDFDFDEHKAAWQDAIFSRVVIENGVTNIGKSAFSCREGLISAELPESVTDIGNCAFSGCKRLKSVNIPDGVTSIGSYAFRRCGSLKSVNIPEGVTSIGDEAFFGCEGLESVTIPESVKFIGDDNFSDCKSLAAINVHGNNAEYSSDERGVLFNKDKSVLIRYPIGNTAESYTIPSGVKTICANAFRMCGRLKSLNIPEGVTNIGDNAFWGCKGLRSVKIPESVASIGEYAFAFCGGLTSVNIPKNVTKISCHAFSACSSLSSVQLPVGVTDIDFYAFSSCVSLTSVTIPEGVTRIGYYAFHHCCSLKSVTIPSSVTSIENFSFAWCESLADITVHEDNAEYSSDERGVLFNKDKSELILYPSGKSDASYTIPSSVTVIRWLAFESCKSLAAILVDGDNSVYSNDERGVLFNKDKSELILYPIGNTAASYAIPSGVVRIGNASFIDCINLTSLTIPEGVTDIGEYSFYDCKNLASVAIPSSVTSIGECAFGGDCYKIEEVFYAGTEKEWTDIAVGQGNDSLINATIHFDSHPKPHAAP